MQNIQTEELQAFALEMLQNIIGIENELAAKAIIAGVLAFIAFVLFTIALRILRHDKSTALDKPSQIPSYLLKKGITIDLCTKDGTAIARCALTKAGKKRIRCEVLELLGKGTLKTGDTLHAIHNPIKAAAERVNAFSCTLTQKGETPQQQLELSTPVRFFFVKRRKHGRKRVLKQQFIRVKLWLSAAKTDDITFPDATPDIGINSYAQDSSGHDANSVLNISKGGIGLRVSNAKLPTTLAVDTTVVISIFMFSFKEKIFKPYWYEGTVRTMEENGPNYTRIGISFDKYGVPDEDNTCITWH